MTLHFNISKLLVQKHFKAKYLTLNGTPLRPVGWSEAWPPVWPGGRWRTAWGRRPSWVGRLCCWCCCSPPTDGSGQPRCWETQQVNGTTSYSKCFFTSTVTFKNIISSRDICWKKTRAVDLHSCFADPDPDVFLNADPVFIKHLLWTVNPYRQLFFSFVFKIQ